MIDIEQHHEQAIPHCRKAFPNGRYTSRWELRRGQTLEAVNALYERECVETCDKECEFCCLCRSDSRFAALEKDARRARIGGVATLGFLLPVILSWILSVHLSSEDESAFTFFVGILISVVGVIVGLFFSVMIGSRRYDSIMKEYTGRIPEETNKAWHKAD